MQISVHRAQMMSLRRPVAWTAWTNSTSSQELVVVERLVLGQQAGEFGQRRPLAGGDVDGRVHDRDPEGLDGPHGRDGVLEQQVVVHRADRGQLGRLVVDEQECRVFRREEMVGERVADRRTGHGSGTFWSQGTDAAEASGHHGDQLSPDSGDCVRRKPADLEHDRAVGRGWRITGFR
jgi:hypothetical protein